MRIKIFGSGSKGNCILVESDDKIVLVDVGFSAKRITEFVESSGYKISQIVGILVTHEHGDHILGLRVFSNKNNIPVYLNEETANALKYRSKNELPESHILIYNGIKFNIKNFTINSVEVNHDCASALAFAIHANGKKIGIATDLGEVSNSVIHHLKDSDLLYIESNYDLNMLNASSRSWELKARIFGRNGHLSNENAAELTKKVICEKTKFLILGHISDECNSFEEVKKQGKKALEEISAAHVELIISTQNEPTKILKI